MKIETIKTEKIKLFKNNTNVMSGKVFSKLMDSIEKNGIIEPLVVKKKKNGYLVLDGNHRLTVAKELGLDEVPCLLLDIPESKEKLYNLHFNETKGELDLMRVKYLVTKMLDKGMTPQEVSKELDIGLLQVYFYWNYNYMSNRLEKHFTHNKKTQPLIYLPLLVNSEDVLPILHKLEATGNSDDGKRLAFYFHDNKIKLEFLNHVRLGKIIGNIFKKQLMK